MSSVQAIEDVTDGEWDTMMAVQLTSAMELTRAVSPGMKERGWGRVIYTSSMAAFAALPGRSAYSATKMALVGLAKSAAIDLGPYGVTVNCLVPGAFPTELVLARFPSEEAQKALRDRNALGRFGVTDDIVGPALLLASDAGSYITGSALVVDGGVLAKM
jgi:NAD(P)-dependent dehydrogenase (short-subunit alcohol dehydrogenase family)